MDIIYEDWLEELDDLLKEIGLGTVDDRSDDIWYDLYEKNFSTGEAAAEWAQDLAYYGRIPEENADEIADEYF